ncbi:MAG: DNA polymerase III subunit delta [Aquificaceae bacterium]|nr:DNA polymerase III subunit delta [Aquificaceae bacterium]MDW8433988.1 DNA polymerase III subunit delta [Aquificaceae bacterium]
MITIREYQKDIEKRTIKPVNLIHGEDEYLVKTFLDKLKELYKSSVRVLWGDELTLEDFERLVLTGGMFGREEVLFFYRASELLKGVKDYKRLASILGRVRSKKAFLYVETKLKEKELQAEPYSTLSRLGDVITADRMDRRRVREMVKNKLTKNGISIEEKALDYMLDVTSNNLMILRGETDKIILYGKSELGLEDVKDIVFPNVELNVFDLWESFLLKEYEKTLNALRAILQEGMHPLQVFGFFVNNCIKLYTAKLLVEEGKSLQEALSLVDVKKQPQLHTFKVCLEKNSRQELEVLLGKLQRLDWSIKVFYSDPAQALEDFVIEYIIHEKGSYNKADA